MAVLCPRVITCNLGFHALGLLHHIQHIQNIIIHRSFDRAISKLSANMHTVTLLTRSTPTLFRQAARALHSSSRTFRPLAFRPTSSSPIASHYLGPNAIAARTFSSNVAVRAPEHASAAVEPPDYLSEGELAVYTKLKKELEPTRLEVSLRSPLYL